MFLLDMALGSKLKHLPRFSLSSDFTPNICVLRFIEFNICGAQLTPAVFFIAIAIAVYQGWLSALWCVKDGRPRARRSFRKISLILQDIIDFARYH